MRNFTAKVVAEHSRVYCLQYDAGTQDSCYFFLQVEGAKELLFLRAIGQGSPAKIETFGKVVASGWGEPDPWIQQSMSEKYGTVFSHAA